MCVSPWAKKTCIRTRKGEIHTLRLEMAGRTLVITFLVKKVSDFLDFKCKSNKSVTLGTHEDL